MPVLVVMPFENRSRDTADAYLTETISEDLVAALGRAGSVRLLSPRGSRRGAEYLLAGSTLRSGQTVRLSARLERSGSHEIVWTTSLDQPASRSTQAAEEVAGRVLDHFGVRRLPSRPAAPRQVDPVTWDLYLRARYHAGRRIESETRLAVTLFRQAVARDSMFAPGWAGLAAAMLLAKRWRLAVPGVPGDSLVPAILSASDRALLADSTNSATWVTRALALQVVDPTTRAASVSALRRAIRLDSLNVDAWTWLGMALEEAGDPTGALAAERRAVALNPGWVEVLSNLALHFYWSGQLDSAAAWADSSVVTDPTYLGARRTAGSVALAQGRLRDAEAQFAAARTVGPGPERMWAIAGLALVAVAVGDSSRARDLVRELASATDTSDVNLHSSVFNAWAHAAIGEDDRALDWLEWYHPHGDLHFQLHLAHDVPFRSLRNEPRFRRLVGP